MKHTLSACEQCRHSRSAGMFSLSLTSSSMPTCTSCHLTSLMVPACPRQHHQICFPVSPQTIGPIYRPLAAPLKRPHDDRGWLLVRMSSPGRVTSSVWDWDQSPAWENSCQNPLIPRCLWCHATVDPSEHPSDVPSCSRSNRSHTPLPVAPCDY